VQPRYGSPLTNKLKPVLLICVLACTWPAYTAAQDVPKPPSSATEAPGLIKEPELIKRIHLWADRHFGKGDITNAWYIDTTQSVPGTGISIGPGYRHWYKKDSVFVDGSAAISFNNSRRAQARLEFPKIARSRIEAGTQIKWHDDRGVVAYAEGPLSNKDSRDTYRIRSNQFAGYLKLRPVKWIALGAELSRLNIKAKGDVFSGGRDERSYAPRGVSLTLDRRDFPDNPARGVLLHAAAVKFDDLDGQLDFTQYEGEAAGFLPLAGGRIVIALHGWGIGSKESETLPLYLQPSLGGPNTLRSFDTYRFRDRNMLLFNGEARFALMTHMALAVFADAGSVAPRWGDVSFDERSYGAGLRLHTRRQTFALVDVAKGREGWRVMLRFQDPLSMSRLLRRAANAPFVPWGGLR
jgi:hypothetical protein